MRKTEKTDREDTHFYIDNAPPREVSQVLRVLSMENAVTLNDIAKIMANEYGFKMQKHHEFSPRRLYDLGLAKQERQGPRVTYKLTRRGLKLQTIQTMDLSLATDLLHYLHYTGYSGNLQDRKYLWTYRRCCEHTWLNGQLISPAQLAAMIQAEIGTTFPHLDFGVKVGMRFNSTAASCVSTWLCALDPPPIIESSRNLQPRLVQRFELVLLALDDTYRARQYQYGDSVLMDESLVNQIAGVFFLDPRCCTDLLRLSANIVPSVKMSDTLSGASINLLRPFSIDDL